jgi:hypothetical protein
MDSFFEDSHNKVVLQTIHLYFLGFILSHCTSSWLPTYLLLLSNDSLFTIGVRFAQSLWTVFKIFYLVYLKNLQDLMKIVQFIGILMMGSSSGNPLSNKKVH